MIVGNRDFEAPAGFDDRDDSCHARIITCEPNQFMVEIHSRMPVILPEKYFQGRLSGSAGKGCEACPLNWLQIPLIAVRALVD